MPDRTTRLAPLLATALILGTTALTSPLAAQAGEPEPRVTPDRDETNLVTRTYGDRPAAPDGFRIAATNAQLPAGWVVHKMTANDGEAGATCNTCGLGNSAYADAEHPISDVSWGAWIYVPFAPGTTGSVDLQVLPAASA